MNFQPTVTIPSFIEIHLLCNGQLHDTDAFDFCVVSLIDVSIAFARPFPVKEFQPPQENGGEIENALAGHSRCLFDHGVAIFQDFTVNREGVGYGRQTLFRTVSL